MRSSDRRSGCFKRLDVTTVTKEIRRKAEEELNETDENITNCLTELRILLKGEKNLAANDSDDFLLQFLRAKKFKTEKAFLTLKNYYGHRAKHPIIYQNFSPKQNLIVLKANIQNFLPMRSREDCAIWVARIGSWNPNSFDYETLVRFGILCHEKELQNPVTQINGIVSLVDLKGFSWTHWFHLSPTMLNCFISLMQDCLPMRHKAIHVINNPSIFGLIFSLIKPFLTQKIRSRIHVHGYNITSLHQYIPPSILPEEFGGTLGPFQNQEFYNSLLDSEEQFIEEQKYGYSVRHK